MNLVISSSWWPAAPAVYLLRAARRAGHDVRTIGPTSGDRCAMWDDAPSFPGFGVTPDLPLDPDAPPHPMSRENRFASELAGWADLWLDVDGGFFIAAPIRTRRRVLVATDPHCASWCSRNNYAAQRAFFPPENVYVMQSRYARPGEKWLPYGYDPEWFFPEDAPQTHDVTNLGAPYPERVAISEALTARGLRVLGPGRTAVGPEHRRQLCAAPVAIVWPLADDLPCRVFEARACGRVVVTSTRVADLRRPGLGDYTFSCPNGNDPPEYIARIAASLSPGRRPRVPPEFVAAHTWDARLAQLIEGRAAP